ncbi:MAG TPA: UDP-N-acetylmuramoyl-tripeptide--D-alanyl-D-alanine ligase [Terriglobales bacterium]|nr:UDP-N-acetylmuramoyl-tripeptide--D-alanyl-D-alanine ligase [Terriglobales bacterium]
MKLPLGRIAQLLSSNTAAINRGALATGYSIDSRTVRPGELFFAVKGEHLDGHDFVEQALDKGATAAVVRADQAARYPGKNAKLIPVQDTLDSLQTLAREVRRMWGKKVVGVTGSVGKTTTKEAIAHLLGLRFKVLKSEGNLNNQFGLPLMLLRLEPEHDIAVIEMGMSHAGEIRALAAIAEPGIGVVTAVAPVHLEFFKSLAEIAAAKRELIEALPANGTAVLNADDAYVSHFGEGFRGKVMTFGLGASAKVRAEKIEELGAGGSNFEIVVGGSRQSATLPLIGRHNVYNALAAVAVAMENGITLTDAAGSLATLTPADKRGEIIKLAGATVINDCYNSNPKALDAMVEALAAMKAKRRIVIAGEMLELGPAAAELHRACGAQMAQRKIDVVIGVRGTAREIVEGAKEAGVAAEFFATPEQAGDWLSREVKIGDAVLLKASRGVRLERALERWQTQLQQKPGQAVAVRH